MKKYIPLSLFFFLPQLVFADLYLPLSFVTLPLFIPIVFLEAFIIWLYIIKRLKKRVTYNRAVGVSLCANSVTSLLGTFIPVEDIVSNRLIWLVFAYIGSIFVEWALFHFLLKKQSIAATDQFILSSYANAASYLFLALGILSDKFLQYITAPVWLFFEAIL
jgi:hypothetical protein